MAKIKCLAEYFSALTMENIEANEEEQVRDLPSISAENESNISNQDIEGDASSHPTNTSDMDNEVTSCDSDPVMWFPVREKHVSFWSKATLICQNKNVLTYMTEVLCCVVAMTIFILERALAFKHSKDIIGSQHNGNVLEIMELIAQFNPFLMGRLDDFGNPGSGKQSYGIYHQLSMKKSFC